MSKPQIQILKELTRTILSLQNKIEQKYSDQAHVYSDSEIKVSDRVVGAKVELIGKDNALTSAPDGDYELQDGFKFTVKDGQIASIEGEPTQVEQEQQTDSTPQDSSSNPSDLDALKQQITELQATTQSIIEAVAQLKEAIQSSPDSQDFADVKKAVETLNEAVLTIAKTPAEFSKTNTSVEVKNEKEEKLNNWARVYTRIKETK